jgi:hypothetical protein
MKATLGLSEGHDVSFLRGVGIMGAGITSCVQFGMEYIKNPEVVERIYFS